MDVRELNYVTSACQGRLLSGSGTTPASGICTDSRRIRAGDVFFALAGRHFDGHNFLPAAAAKGASAVVIERHPPPDLPGACAVIGVDSTRQALGRLAARYREEFSLPVIAVGGSNGKTTTKDLIASVLRQGQETLWSEASFNNDIGVPLTLLRLSPSHRVAVMEAGTNHPGELAPLLRMIRPRYGVLTHIGREHLEYFGDLAGVAEEEGWLAELLPAAGKLYLNGDCDWTPRLRARAQAEVITVGISSACVWRARAIRLDRQGATFRVDAPAAAFAGEYRIALLGKHQVRNALFALALGAELGLDRGQIERGLAECPAPRMRLQLRELNGVRVLDDAYNANADSMIAALQTLQDLPCRGRRVAVLGDMAELGAQTEAAHEEVGRRTAELGVGQLFAVGKMAPVTARAARSAGLNRVMEFPDVESAAAAVRGFVRSGDVVLLKASREAQIERIADALKSEKT
jgi:UDP-N-acetylmuramoyl-tripeptide--D-alanyl-D-alanine ligase